MTTAGTEAVELKAMGLDGEAVPGGHFFLQLFDFAIFELHDSSAVGANEVVVVALVGDVVVLSLGTEVAGLGQAGFAKEIEGAVDRREPEMRVFSRKLMIHLFRRDVFLLEERVENQFTLAGEFQLMLSEMLLEHLHLFRVLWHNDQPDIL
jgi:hypothetical protein